ncbi:MAG: hypothetical protein PHC74_07520 [Sulfurimonas sp.]|nr:hypothetical protein [Sulfurimonas sp.]
MEQLFFKNTWSKAIIPLILMGVVSLSGNTLVVEISTNNNIDWLQVPKKISFYILIVSTLILAYYQMKIAQLDKELMKGFTPKQYEARMRNRMAEDVEKRSRKLIGEGKIQQLEEETENI